MCTHFNISYLWTFSNLICSVVFSQKIVLVTWMSKPPYRMTGQSKKMVGEWLSFGEHKRVYIFGPLCTFWKVSHRRNEKHSIHSSVDSWTCFRLFRLSTIRGRRAEGRDRMIESVSRRAFSGSSGTYNVRASELARDRRLKTLSATVVFLDDTEHCFQIEVLFVFKSASLFARQLLFSL
jgi:hypothetical protein